MGRSEARENAFQFLYELSIQKEDREEQEGYFLESHPMTKADLEFFRRLVDGVMDEQEKLDEMIAPKLRGWKLERLPLIDLSILRLSIFELLHVDEVPPSVSISEAVLLAKKYSSEEARSYINAVLGGIAREAANTSAADESNAQDVNGI